MNETPHAFAIGDDVISVGCIVAPPTEPHGVRLEIPLACRGTVVDVRPYDYPKPYVVDFEVPEAGGVVVEVEVTGDQIAKVASPDKPDAEQLERLVRTPPHKLRALLHEPSTSHPHHSCRFWHTVHKLLFLSCGVLALMRNPVTVLMAARRAPARCSRRRRAPRSEYGAGSERLGCRSDPRRTALRGGDPQLRQPGTSDA